MPMGHRKGSSYERRVCALLSEWKGIPRSFTRERYGLSDVHVADDFPFSIELKHRKVINILDVLVSQSTSNLLNALEQTERNAIEDKRYPMFIFRQNRCVDVMVLRCKEGVGVFNYLHTKGVPSIKIKLNTGQQYYCFRLSSVMDVISYKEFVNLYATQKTS